MTQLTAIVFDRDPTRRDGIRQRLLRCGILPICFGDAWVGLENLAHLEPALAFYWCSDQERAIQFTHIAKAIRPALPLVLISDQPLVRNWVDSHWPREIFFLAYPTDDQAVSDAVAAVDPSRPRPGRPVLVAGAPDSLKRIQSLPLLGAAKEPLLIQGEAGVGKRLTAAAIHSWAMADQGEPQWVQAGAISEGWIVRWQRRLQASEATDGQGLFVVIENIEQLDLDLQGRLLPMLEDHAENSGNQAGRKNVRFITLAEADLARLTRQGRFRQDLYHRISVLKLNLPPLRDRLDDIVALADFFAATTAVGNGASVLRLPDAVRELLATYHWPGNASELRDAIQQSPLAQGAKEGEAALGDWFRDYIERHRHPFGVSAIDVSGELRRFLKNNRDTSLKRAKQHCGRQVEIRFMRAALSRTNGNFKQAARLLRISYKSMLNKAKAYHLSG